jgi:hypothetical protein
MPTVATTITIPTTASIAGYVAAVDAWGKTETSGVADGFSGLKNKC